MRVWLPPGQVGRSGKRFRNPAEVVAGVFSDGYDTFGLEGNASFDPNAPTLKDGTSITGATNDPDSILTQYNTAMHWVLNVNDSNHADTNITPQLAGTNWYDVGRGAHPYQSAMLHVFRLTGDLRILDRLATAYEALYSNLNPSEFGQIAFPTPYGYNESCGTSDPTSNLDCGSRSSCTPPGDPPWSPYWKLTDAWYAGYRWNTDLETANNGKAFAALAEFVWTLWINRNKTSPGSLDYDALATKWLPIVRDNERAWGFNFGCGAQNYRADVFGDNAVHRADWGVWPMLHSDGSHMAMQTALRVRYACLLGLHAMTAGDIANPQDGLDWIHDDFMNRMVNSVGSRGPVLKPTTVTAGPALVFRRGQWFGDASDRALTHETHNSGHMTYVNHTDPMFVTLWLTGEYRTSLTLERMRLYNRAVAGAFNADGSNEETLLEDCVNLSTSSPGTASRPQDTESGLFKIDGGNSLTQVARQGQGYGVVFTPDSEGFLLDVAKTVQGSVPGGGWIGMGGDARASMHAVALFVRSALYQAGDLS